MSNYQMLDENHPVNQGIKAKELGRSSITGNQDKPHVVELKQPNAPEVEDITPVDEKTHKVNVELSFTTTEFAGLSRQAAQRKLDIKDVIQIVIDESLVGSIGKTFISGPGGNKPLIKGPSIHKSENY